MAIITPMRIPVPMNLPDKFMVTVPRVGAIYGLETEKGQLYMFGCFDMSSGERGLDVVIVCDGLGFEASDTSYVGAFNIEKVDIDAPPAERAVHLRPEWVGRTSVRHIFMVSIRPLLIPGH
jgi:hypothetical protein